MKKSTFKYSIFLLCYLFLSLYANAKDNSNSLKVKEIIFEGVANCQQVSKLLEKETDLQFIDVTNWEKYQYKPEVKFRIAHSNNQIWLKYYVSENNIMAKQSATNSSVCTDSCVEFFFDPKGDGNYYNFEFSCIGVSHVAYGQSIRNRKFVNPEKIEMFLQTESSLGKQIFLEKSGDYSWELTIIIPSEILIFTKGVKFKKLKSKANFYKCGDNTTEPHYLTWNPVKTKAPDFHQPVYFGEILFE